MRSMKAYCLIGLLVLATILAIVSHQQHQVEAGKKKLIKTALLAALLLKAGKKILLPLPIPVPVPFLKQTQPVYYQQPQYEQYHQPQYQQPQYYQPESYSSSYSSHEQPSYDSHSSYNDQSSYSSYAARR